MRECLIEEQHSVLMKREDLVDAIKKIHGAKPLLLCREADPPGKKTSMNIFKEVLLCFDKSLEPVDCQPSDLR